MARKIKCPYELASLVTIDTKVAAGQNPGDLSGSGVDIYADGFQKAPLLGRQLCGFRGTSAAAPAIVNLAAKILAIQPALSPVQVVDLMKRGGSRNEEGLLVAKPKNSLDFLGTFGKIRIAN